MNIYRSFFSSRTLKSIMSKLNDIPDVDIDSTGIFKYILIKVTDTELASNKLIVRGCQRCHYHADILEETETKEGGNSLTFKCLGGGRIKHEDKSKTILVYGYSQGFGQANHQKSVDILKKRYPNYSITFSNEGY